LNLLPGWNAKAKKETAKRKNNGKACRHAKQEKRKKQRKPARKKRKTVQRFGGKMNATS